MWGRGDPGKGPALCFSKNQESKAWMGMTEVGTLASVFPPCLLHTCLLCPQPRTQLSQSRVTYPHMSGSAAFPTMVILVARVFITVGSEGSCDSVPGVHSSVCHTHTVLRNRLFPREVWRKRWGQMACFCVQLLL